jgi:hypothetical protein
MHIIQFENLGRVDFGLDVTIFSDLITSDLPLTKLTIVSATVAVEQHMYIGSFLLIWLWLLWMGNKPFRSPLLCPR